MPCEFPWPMSAHPDLGPKPTSATRKAASSAPPNARPDDVAIAALAAQPSAGAYVIGGDLIVMKKGAAAQRSAVHLGRSARAGRGQRDDFPRPARWRRAFRLRPRAGGGRGAENARRFPRHRSAIDRSAGPGRRRPSAADRRGQGGAALARAASLLPELRPPDTARASRLEARSARTARPSISRAPIRW